MFPDPDLKSWMVVWAARTRHWLCCWSRLSGSERRLQQVCSPLRAPYRWRRTPVSCWRITYWPSHALSSSSAWTYRYTSGQRVEWNITGRLLLHPVALPFNWKCLKWLTQINICVDSCLVFHSFRHQLSYKLLIFYDVQHTPGHTHSGSLTNTQLNLITPDRMVRRLSLSDLSSALAHVHFVSTHTKQMYTACDW